MLVRMLIPVIAWILLGSLENVVGIAKLISDDFYESYELLRCARIDVYERNITDAALYLNQKEPSFEVDAVDLLPAEEECFATAYAVYREANEGKGLLYPNWTYLEATRE